MKLTKSHGRIPVYSASSTGVHAIIAKRWRDRDHNEYGRGTNKRSYWHVAVHVADRDLIRNFDRLQDVRRWLDVAVARGVEAADVAYRADWEEL